MDVTKSLNCREIRDCDVVDSNGEKVGKISDMTFTFDGDLKLSQFILAGSAWEEFLESVKIKPDKDPLFDASLIRRIGDKVQLTANVNSLKTTLDEDAIPSGEIRWSALQEMDIIDKDDVKVGRAVDIDFDNDGTASLIVGGGLIEETLESWGLKADIDIIVPAETITSMGDKVKLSVSKDELKLTMDKALDSPEVKRAKEDRSTDRDVMKVRLFHHRPM
ncbi:MAG: PRC-barrel domain-containing protein [Candidatus Thorarchaeota archaeon]